MVQEMEAAWLDRLAGVQDIVDLSSRTSESKGDRAIQC